MTTQIPVAVAYGDGIGPEIMTATLRILKAANANIEPVEIALGEQVFLDGHEFGITEDAFQTIKATQVLLKAPITTPKGNSYQSLNILLRKILGIYANVQFFKSLSPYVPSHHPDTDLIIVREFSEDAYVRIEHHATLDAFQALKLTSRSGSERVIRYAFEYAQQFHRKKVSCFAKDNILEITDGVFRKVFNEISARYSNIEHEFALVDEGIAAIANEPTDFDIVVLENMYADILDNIVSSLVGSVALSGSTNIGEHVVLFEPNHGSGADIKGQRTANPSGLINAAIQMLVYLKQYDTAALIENAWLKTIEDGFHTLDLYRTDYSEKKLNTDEFSEAVIDRLGDMPSRFDPVDFESVKTYREEQTPEVLDESIEVTFPERELVGVDVFIHLPLCGPAALVELIANQLDTPLTLQLLTHRHHILYPNRFLMSDWYEGDYWRCRFQGTKGFSKAITYETILQLLHAFERLHIEVVQFTNLYTYDGKLGFSLAREDLTETVQLAL